VKWTASLNEAGHRRPTKEEIVDKRVAVISGGSSGIGAATARRLAAEGFEVVVGARRVDRLREVAEPIGALALPLDVTDTASVEAFAAQVPMCHLLVNNAGGAKGMATVADADEEHWRWMYDANVLGTLRMTKAFLPKLIASGSGHVVNVSSIAGLEVYENGGGYTAAKHGETVLTTTLRWELLGQPVRVTEIDPGFTDTEFSLVRFGGDAERATKVYQGMTPLTADDIADCIAWAVTRPGRVNIDQIVVKPLDQANVTRIFRRPG
jgi:NADP-dependent 3-hydroxy acid dehydrogenase YdfG